VLYRLENEHARQLVADAIFQAEHALGGEPAHHRAPHKQVPHDQGFVHTGQGNAS
jgi:hypothetical protein